MILMYVAAALLAGLTIFVLILGVVRFINTGSQVDDRLQAYASASLPIGDGDSDPNLADRANRYLNDRSFAGSVSIKLARAGVKLTVPEYILIKMGSALLPAVILLLVHQLLLGVLVGGICFLLPDFWLKRRERKRQQQFNLQLPDTLAMIVSGLRAGFSLQHSMQNVSKEAAEPTASEFKRLSQELQLGVPLLGALDGLVRRIKSEDLEMIVSVFKIHSRVGGNLAQVLETVSFTIRERVKLRRDVQVITSMQRMSAYILGLMPPGMALVIFVINRSYIMEIFHWNVFLCIPVFAFTMSVIGFLVIKKMADIKI